MSLGALLIGLAIPAAASASAPKVILPSAGTNNDEPTAAELNATIKPDGARTSYEFWVEEGGTGVEVGHGELSASELERRVSAEASGLLPNHTYIWEVVAGNADGSARGGGEFTTFPELPAGCPMGCPVEPPHEPTPPPPPPWLIEALNRSAQEAVQRENERQAKKKQEEEATAAKELALREEGERNAREAAEREALAHAVHCIVPRLHGDSLAQARRMLRKANCSLGAVHRPSHGRRLVVTAQGGRVGRKLTRGAPVGVTLGSRPAQRRR